MKRISLLLLFVLIIGVSNSCSDAATNAPVERHDVIGELKWSGEPALDGLGITFETDDNIYGIQASKSDFEQYFSGDENNVLVKADLLISGKMLIRSFNVKLPEAEITRLEKLK